jgi:hypothetical protein
MATTTGPTWTEMSCGICGETWALPCGPAGQAFALEVVAGSVDHWLAHVKRGEDPRIPADKWPAYARGSGR